MAASVSSASGVEGGRGGRPWRAPGGGERAAAHDAPLPPVTVARFQEATRLIEVLVDENTDLFIDRMASYRERARAGSARRLTPAEAAQVAAAIGGAMAIALLATLYGALLANLVFMPIANRLRVAGRSEAFERARIEAPLVALAERELPQSMRSAA